MREAIPRTPPTKTNTTHAHNPQQNISMPAPIVGVVQIRVRVRSKCRVNLTWWRWRGGLRAEGGKGGHIGLVEKPRHVEVRLAITHIKRKSFYCTTNFTIFFALWHQVREKLIHSLFSFYNTTNRYHIYDIGRNVFLCIDIQELRHYAIMREWRVGRLLLEGKCQRLDSLGRDIYSGRTNAFHIDWVGCRVVEEVGDHNN